MAHRFQWTRQLAPYCVIGLGQTQMEIVASKNGAIANSVPVGEKQWDRLRIRM
ncbi:hypothetical protein PAXRUDRAFT_831038 [Paxillus rubicundulus Ve08.2h10]|uniref:Uncharacterized protein n=1 Tax=Paxillus rubicundulus Ve08.2h10 TaxID=930991 RepID=A0A0D0DSL3_9AGAM|nr:hypothetical protein PAXRUDRAFT_831038 [Paxillus rubicundulus Ve08.2h10]